MKNKLVRDFQNIFIEKCKKNIYLKKKIFLFFFEVYHEKSDLFVEMEYAAGGSLLDRIHKTYIMDEDECKFIFYQIGCALAYLHRLKIVKKNLNKFKKKNFFFFFLIRFIEILNQLMFFLCQMNEKQ